MTYQFPKGSKVNGVALKIQQMLEWMGKPRICNGDFVAVGRDHFRLVVHEDSISFQWTGEFPGWIIMAYIRHDFGIYDILSDYVGDRETEECEWSYSDQAHPKWDLLQRSGPEELFLVSKPAWYNTMVKAVYFETQHS